jgi:pimeloyl-ACP methyl ester carboxylesterase
MSKTVVLIHGAWLSAASWELFKARYESRGLTVVAPGWPFMDRPVEELRRAPLPALAHLSIHDIVVHYARIIESMPTPPMIIGHSFGGLITELLLERGLGSVGVAIAPAAFRGVIPRPRTLISAIPTFLAWNGWNRVLTMTFEQFAANFAQALPPADLRRAYDRYIVGAPGRIYWEGALGISTGITPVNAHRAPLLLIAGERDRTVAPSMVAATYRVQRHAPSLTEFKLFPRRSHFICAEPGWEEVADYSLQWAMDHARSDVRVLPSVANGRGAVSSLV